MSDNLIKTSEIKDAYDGYDGDCATAQALLWRVLSVS